MFQSGLQTRYVVIQLKCIDPRNIAGMWWMKLSMNIQQDKVVSSGQRGSLVRSVTEGGSV